jgi:regulation of enolase protein 1 (concanavalin A-like superfamily)
MIDLLETPELLQTLSWLNEPTRWEHDGRALELWPDAKSDFWQKTHYGFQADNGHLLYTEAGGDFELATHVTYTPVHQYDQAGLMVYFSSNNWLKCSVEGEIDEPFRLGAVVTRDGYSDWSTQSYDAAVVDIDLRVFRRGPDFFVFWRPSPDGDWIQMRVAHLVSGTACCGLYACSPKDAGFSARFTGLSLDR